MGGLCPRIRLEESSRLSCADSRRSGRVAEGGALLRRYGDECLHRGFESLLLRFATRLCRVARLTGETMFPPFAPFFGARSARVRAAPAHVGRGGEEEIEEEI